MTADRTAGAPGHGRGDRHATIRVPAEGVVEQDRSTSVERAVMRPRGDEQLFLSVPATEGFATVIEAVLHEALATVDPRLDVDPCVAAVARLGRDLLALPARPLWFELTVRTEPTDLYVRVGVTLGDGAPVELSEGLRADLHGCTASHDVSQEGEHLVVVLQLDLLDLVD